MKIGGAGIAIAAIVALIAFATNPGAADHEREAGAIAANEMGKAIRQLDFGSLAGALQSGLGGDREYLNLLVMSFYDVKVDGASALRCFGIFGKVTCSASAPPPKP